MNEIINCYQFQTNKNGTVEVSFHQKSNKDLLKPILMFLVSLAAVIGAFFIEGDLKYVLWIIGGMVFVLSFFALSTFFQPQIFVVSKDGIQFKGRWIGKSSFAKNEIDDITYNVEQINRSGTSLMGKEDWPYIKMKLKDGTEVDLLMIEKDLSNMTRTYEEEIDAKKIINLIKKTLSIS